jgi:hypothetical protein
LAVVAFVSIGNVAVVISVVGMTTGVTDVTIGLVVDVVEAFSSPVGSLGPLAGGVVNVPLPSFRELSPIWLLAITWT